jgi:AAA15 family ATPase/GTPase
MAVIYGANASGKTTLFDALFTFIDAIAKSHKEDPLSKSYYISPYSFDESEPTPPTEMELTFAMDGVRYNYGFTHVDGEFIEEWLYGYPSTKPIEYFYRKKGQRIRFSDHLKGRKKVLEELTRPDSLFLSSSSMNGHEYLGEMCRRIFRSFSFIHNDALANLEKSLAQMLLKESDIKPFMLDLLEEASAGIEDVEVEEVKVDDNRIKTYKSVLNPEIADDFLEKLDIKSSLDLHFVHRGRDGGNHRLNIFEESSGTRKLFALSLPIFHVLKNGGVLIVDELDAKIHELMVLSIIEIFRNTKINKSGAQLVFNTHNSSFLKSSLFRKDQIWFTEKAQDGTATLYPLTDFQPRSDKDVARGYIQGLYGAVPWRGQLGLNRASAACKKKISSNSSE